MKRILLIAGLLGYLVPTYAQTEPINVNEDFEVPVNSYKMNRLPSGWTTKNAAFRRDANLKCNGNVGVSVNLWQLSKKAKLITPTYTSNGEPINFSFSYKVVNSNSTIGTSGDEFSLKLEYSTDGGNSWTTKENFGGANHQPSTSCVVKEIAFTPTEIPAGEVKFRFFAELITDDEDADFRVVLDDVIIGQSVVGTINHELANLNIFPNPTTDYVNISSAEKIDTISVFDFNGRRISNVETNDFNAKIDVKHLASGTYFILIKAGEKTATEQIIIK